jgi:Holliday junction resolvase
MRAERQIVELFRDAGLDAYRAPLSGSVSGFKSDIEVRIGTRTLHLESKVRAHKFTFLYQWLFGADAVIVKADRKPALIAMLLQDFAALLQDIANQPQIPGSKPSQN